MCHVTHILTKCDVGLGQVPVHAIKVHEGVEVYLQLFLPSILDGVNDQLHVSVALPPEINSHIQTD